MGRQTVFISMFLLCYTPTGFVVGAVITQAPLCCFPNEFEVLTFVTQGAVNLQSRNVHVSSAKTRLSSADRDVSSGNVPKGFAIGNGTMKITYDATNQRTYRHQKTVTYSSVFPGYSIVEEFVEVMDYKNVSGLIFSHSLSVL